MVINSFPHPPNHIGKTPIFHQDDQNPEARSTAALPWQEVQASQSKTRLILQIVLPHFFLNPVI